jgi:hypothetical protein
MDYDTLLDHLARSSRSLRAIGCSEREVVEGIMSELALCGGPSVDHLQKMIGQAKHPVLDAPVEVERVTKIPIKYMTKPFGNVPEKPGDVVRFPRRFKIENCQGE